jgi:hypothetical protein
MNYAPHILSFAVGLWLIIFGLMSRSAKPILADPRFIYSVLAAGGAVWAFIIGAVIISAFDNAVSFAPPDPLITPFTLNPLATAALGAGFLLLGLAGFVIRRSANPARILMWVVAFVAVAVTAAHFSGDNYWFVPSAIVGMVAALIFLRKRKIPSYVVGAIVIISAATIVLSYQTEEIEGYYPEQTPAVSFVTSRTDAILTIEGVELRKMTNSSRILGPECSLDPVCVENYSEGLTELSINEGSDGQTRIISATLSNTGKNPVNVTLLHLTGLITADTGKPQYLEVLAIRDPFMTDIMPSLMAPKEELSDGSTKGPVVIKPGESLSAYIKGEWIPYSEQENSAFPFQVSARYEYEILPLIRSLNESTNCLEYCAPDSQLPSNFHRGYWSLTAGPHYTELTKLPVNIISQSFYGSDQTSRLSYAGCMSANDAEKLYSSRNITLGFPDYLPAGFSLICRLDESGSPAFVQIYGNTSSPGIRDYLDDDPRLLYRTSSREHGSLIVSMRLGSTPNEFITEAAARQHEFETRNEFSSIESSSLREVQGGSIFVEVFEGGAAAVDLNLADRQYHVFGNGVSADELVKVAESISRW